MNIEFSKHIGWEPLHWFKEGDVVMADNNEPTPHLLLILGSGRVFHLRANETGVAGDDKYRGLMWRKVDAKLVVNL